jgi:hypothetical protein
LLEVRFLINLFRETSQNKHENPQSFVFAGEGTGQTNCLPGQKNVEKLT